MSKKRTLKKRKKVLSKFRCTRNLLENARLKGARVGRESQVKETQKIEKSLRSEYDKRLSEERVAKKKALDALRVESGVEVSGLKDDHKKKFEELKSEHTKEILTYKKQYEDRMKRNNKLKEESLAEALVMKETAKKSEQFWRNEIYKINEFQMKAMAAVRTISDRYEFLQASMSKVQVGKDMVTDLKESYNKLINNANKNAPLLDGSD